MIESASDCVFNDRTLGRIFRDPVVTFVSFGSRLAEPDRGPGERGTDWP